MVQNHFGLLCDVSELTASLAGSRNLAGFLHRVVELVARHMRSEVCSIYLAEPSGELVMADTCGLDASAIGSVRLQPDQGLVGWAYTAQQTVCEQQASKHPRYHHVPGIGEELYEAFLGVPIKRSQQVIGVLVVQRRDADAFTPHDVQALQATAAQLVNALESARALRDFHGPARPAGEAAPPPLEVVAGEVASEGVALAPATVINRQRAFHLLAESAADQVCTPADFDRALEETAQQLEELQASLAHKLPEVAALIFSAHLLMLKDDGFTGQIRDRMASGQPAPAAVIAVAHSYIDLFAASPNPYIREKAQDVEDLAKRLVGNLRRDLHEPGASCHQHIVLANTLYPSDILKLASEEVSAIVLISGGITSHVCILARSLQIPLLLADQPRLLDLPEGTDLALDGYAGQLYVHPGPEVVSRLRQLEASHRVTLAARAVMRPETRTQDGTRVRLLANINLLGDLALARELKAEGVGLYRSEFPFLIRSDFPSEEEQYPLYRNLLENAPGDEITFRTLDIGGDKVVAYYGDGIPEANPHLGLRSIRFSLRHTKLFHEQLRAFLRATAAVPPRHFRLMFPMISSLDELLAARHEVEVCREALLSEGHGPFPPLKIGIMVEVPSLMDLLGDLAPHSDFFCIGTNDFIQFLLAVDRGNEKVAPYFRPYHPAVLRALKRIADEANRHQVELSICGEMAHEVEYLPFLLGIGMRHLSVDPRFLPRVQERIATIELPAAQAWAEEVLRLDTLAALRPYFTDQPLPAPCAAASP